MNYTAWIGIDPGLAGGIAIITDIDVEVTPTLLEGDEIDIGQMRCWLETYIDIRQPVAIIEKVHSMPEQSAQSGFTFGLVTGEMRGMLKAMYIPFFTITPQAWKKAVLVGTDHSKDAAIAFCRNAYPNIPLLATSRSRTPHTGIADALCMAHYGKMHFG